jgi:hypothetical protein
MPGTVSGPAAQTPAMPEILDHYARIHGHSAGIAAPDGAE